MEDETGTTEIEGGASSEQGSQLEATSEEVAENDQTETQSDSTTEQDNHSDDDDEDLAWATKKGVDLNDPKKVAKMLRDADRKVSQAGLAKTELQKATSESVEDEGNVAVLNAKLSTMQYYFDNPEARELDSVATQILFDTMQEDPALAAGLAKNLDMLFSIAKQRASDGSVDQAREEGRKEERAALASKQRAFVTSSAASKSAPSTGADDDFLKGFMGKA